jgi:hypothetical protein
MTTAPGTPPPPTRLTARSPEDLLAVVPVVLGFVPHESVVMLTFDAGHPFHARVDLPRRHADVDEVVDALCRPAIGHRVPRVVFVLYAARAGAARRVAGALLAAFGAAGIDVVDVLRADGRRWFPLLRPHPGAGPTGVPYDVSAHAFAAQAVLDGRVTHASREELADSIEARPDRVAGLVAALGAPPRRTMERAGEERWAGELVRRHVADGAVPADPEVARLLVALGERRVLDGVRAAMTRAQAAAHVAFWTDVVRRAPDDLLAAPAALLGLAAWLAGHGALAWCALDRCAAVDPDHALAEEVAQLLLHAVPPRTWEADRP